MTSDRSVRYLRCVGSDVSDNPHSAFVALVRLRHDRGKDWFAGYVILNDQHEVIEKSDHYGRYEDSANWIESQNECKLVSREEFSAAWRQPYARRSLIRRFLSKLNGTSDRSDPSESDP